MSAAWRPAALKPTGRDGGNRARTIAAQSMHCVDCDGSLLRNQHTGRPSRRRVGGECMLLHSTTVQVQCRQRGTVLCRSVHSPPTSVMSQLVRARIDCLHDARWAVDLVKGARMACTTKQERGPDVISVAAAADAQHLAAACMMYALGLYTIRRKVVNASSPDDALPRLYVTYPIGNATWQILPAVCKNASVPRCKPSTCLEPMVADVHVPPTNPTSLHL
jgi:hypothetical protein